METALTEGAVTMTRSRQVVVMAEISSVMTTILRRGGGPPRRGSHRHPCRHLIVVVLILMARLRCHRCWMRRRKQGRIDPGVRNRIRIIILPLSQLWVGNYYVSLLMCCQSTIRSVLQVVQKGDVSTSPLHRLTNCHNSEKATPIHFYMSPLSLILRPSSDMNQQRTTIYVPPLI